MSGEIHEGNSTQCEGKNNKNNKNNKNQQKTTKNNKKYKKTFFGRQKKLSSFLLKNDWYPVMSGRYCNTLVNGNPRQRIEAQQDRQINKFLAIISTTTDKPLWKRTAKDKTELRYAIGALNKARHERCVLLIEHDKSDWVFVPTLPCHN